MSDYDDEDEDKQATSSPWCNSALKNGTLPRKPGQPASQVALGEPCGSFRVALKALCGSLVHALGSHWGGLRVAGGWLATGFEVALMWL